MRCWPGDLSYTQNSASSRCARSSADGSPSSNSFGTEFFAPVTASRNTPTTMSRAGVDSSDSGFIDDRGDIDADRNSGANRWYGSSCARPVRNTTPSRSTRSVVSASSGSAASRCASWTSRYSSCTRSFFDAKW